jgi:hypothetical protein
MAGRTGSIVEAVDLKKLLIFLVPLKTTLFLNCQKAELIWIYLMFSKQSYRNNPSKGRTEKMGFVYYANAKNLSFCMMEHMRHISGRQIYLTVYMKLKVLTA